MHCWVCRGCEVTVGGCNAAGSERRLMMDPRQRGVVCREGAELGATRSLASLLAAVAAVRGSLNQQVWNVALWCARCDVIPKPQMRHNSTTASLQSQANLSCISMGQVWGVQACQSARGVHARPRQCRSSPSARSTANIIFGAVETRVTFIMWAHCFAW
jgi:hypothetical protein